MHSLKDLYDRTIKLRRKLKHGTHEWNKCTEILNNMEVLMAEELPQEGSVDVMDDVISEISALVARLFSK